MAFTSVLIVGLYSDGWAHANLLDELEGFVTPWHTVVFVGYALTAGWIVKMIHRRRTPERSLRESIPPGWQWAVAGVLTFAVGFNGDAIWHTIFGLESDVDALLSPTHLLMGTSLLAIVSSPFRSRPASSHAQTWRDDGTRVLSLLLTTLVAGFFLLYLWIPAFNIGSQAYEAGLAEASTSAFLTEVSQIAVLASAFIITALMLVPVTVTARGGLPPRGAAFALVVVPALAITAIREFSNPQSLIGFVLAGLAAEAISRRVNDPRSRTLLLGGIVPAVLWLGYWTAFTGVYTVAWEVELYAGQVVSAVVAGLATASVVARPPFGSLDSRDLRQTSRDGEPRQTTPTIVPRT